MSSLQESVDARRAAKPAEFTCASVTSQVTAVTALLVNVPEGRTWALPWSGLIAAWVDDAGDHERLHLAFTGYVVTAAGRNLRRVLDAIVGFRLASLRSVPAEFSARVAADAPLIMRLEVRASDSAAVPKTRGAS